MKITEHIQQQFLNLPTNALHDNMTTHCTKLFNNQLLTHVHNQITYVCN